MFPALSANADNSPGIVTYRSVAAGHGKNKEGQLENVQYHPVSGAISQQELQKLKKLHRNITRRSSWSGRSTPMEDMLGTRPHLRGERPPNRDVARH